jgi:hypothetical protein
MAFKLKIKNKNTNPSAGNLDVAELGYNTSSTTLFVGNGASAPTEVVMAAGNQTIAGTKTFSSTINGSITRTVTGTSSVELVRGNMADNDQARILVGGTASNAGFLEISTADDGTEPIHFRQYTGVFTTLVRTATILDGSGNTILPGTLQHTGLNMTTGTNVDQTKSTTFTSALTTAWTDVTGVSGTYLATGSYIVQIISNGEYYTGNMSWFSGSTTTTTVDEIELHRAGAAASAARIYARVARVSSGTLKLQVSASASLSSHTMTFTFRRTI